ncbi:1,4-alpha-glucan branching enzyme [Paenibacillus phyllosphaerae]|uniref:1,4-alpha-glucan branching enzyme n=1 Tax=Paenibacillus phyllosphaerae TaxID=274593 RepID=A0A7W5FMZ3_9BACL|nr:1,4-alpha-glucan branching protein domain-containing protein [Paenibacillus phyllosphaerae]MBB3110755.1 1,4-alpha-glucan branching enzyme [Paenibacillus phyllosphaerae]
MAKGYLSLVLHAHLPFVYHPESENYIEERWLFEAMTETYIPLLEAFERLERDQVEFRITMSLTPTLLTMLAKPLLQERYVRHLDNLIQLAASECKRVRQEPDLAALAAMYLEQFKRTKSRFVDSYGCNLVNGFMRYQEAGYLELITCSATHAFLPYVQTEQALRAQIDNAVRIHTSSLGRAPKGIWLPECGFKEGLDAILKDYGIDFFFTDTHHVLHARPKPEHGVYAPLVTPSGVAAFARDQETSKQVWSSLEGYPGDHDYREYYRDIGYDLDEEYMRRYMHSSGVRLNTGIKYYRITGEGQPKDVYRPAWAREKAAQHAGNFMYNREKQVEHLSAHMGRKPIVVASYDAELFGHWWHEGPMWIEFLCRKIHFDQDTIAMITPLEYLAEYPDQQQAELAFGSWGRAGYGEVWLGQTNEWIYRHLHRMEEQMIELADRYPDATGVKRKALNQAARELMLAQSSDWAFIMDAGTMVDYAQKRTKNHIVRFRRLYRDLMRGELQEEWLREVEARDCVSPDLDYRIYRSKLPVVKESSLAFKVEPRQRVLILAWEFPPMIVGGLSRHVFDLSRKLAEQQIEVHVVTTHVDGYPSYEVNQGVHVHRVATYQTQSVQFMEWVFQLNLAMTTYATDLIKHYGPFDLIHAHDWIVGQAAKALKHKFQLPLIATIHATEHGRNHGLHTPLQHRIHALEWELTYEAWRVIVCSEYMRGEVLRLFHLPADKVDTIPNGVETEAVVRVEENAAAIQSRYASPEEKVILFIGRLVREKGVHVLIESFPSVLASCPEAKVIIAGHGPMQEDLKQLAYRIGVAHKVDFVGYADDKMRNELLKIAAVAVFPSLYEPFGIVALEAMAAGTPVIVSGTGGLQEIIQHGVDGFTVLPDDAASLTLHTVKMLEFEDMAKAMSRKAFHKVNTRYNWDRIGEMTTGVYDRVAPRPVNDDAIEHMPKPQLA